MGNPLAQFSDIYGQPLVILGMYLSTTHKTVTPTYPYNMPLTLLLKNHWPQPNPIRD